MKKNKKKVKGFSLVELLAVITILGILTLISVISIQRIIVKAKQEYYNALERNMIVAAESFITNHNELKPKVDGDSKDITLETLKNNKYIDEVVDYYKEKCDDKKSYVRVFNYNKELHYTAYLECPNYKSNPSEKYANIKAAITFDGNLDDANAKLELQDEEYGLASYKYEIIKNNKVVYKSDNILLGQTKSEIIKNIKVTKYTPATIKIKVT
ncbi:MAG: type II secretion system protein, partial [Bacilli bacterium]|nr:type II secretion system protein [Bacilli bacterium]